MTYYIAIQNNEERFEGLISGETEDEIKEKLKALKLKKYGVAFRTSDLQKPHRSKRVNIYYKRTRKSELIQEKWIAELNTSA